MDGIIHPYYTVALAPAIAALVGISVRELWRGREFVASRIVLAVMSAGTGVWAFILMDRTPDWWPARALGRVDRLARHRFDPGGRGTPSRPFRSGIDHRRNVFRCSRACRIHHRDCGELTQQRADGDGGSEPRRPDGTAGRWRKWRSGPWRRGQSRARKPRRRSGQPLGRSHRRLDGCEQSRTEDRRIGHGDRRVHRRRQLADTRAVPGLRRQP